jgi:hypothetical protein
LVVAYLVYNNWDSLKEIFVEESIRPVVATDTITDDTEAEAIVLKEGFYVPEEGSGEIVIRGGNTMYVGDTQGKYVVKGNKLIYTAEKGSDGSPINNMRMEFFVEKNAIIEQNEDYTLTYKFDGEITPQPSGYYNNSNTVNIALGTTASQRLLTVDDLRGLSKQELRIMRNEIYARHGRKFKSQDLRDYFSAQDWYKPLYDEVPLNDIEKKNVAFIQKYE